MTMRRRHRRGAGVDVVCFAAFGAGLLTCCILPTKLLVVILGVALVICGVSCGKH